VPHHLKQLNVSVVKQFQKIKVLTNMFLIMS